jgi:somatostatin receptor 1
MFDTNNMIINTTIITVTILPKTNPITYYFVPCYAILFLIGTFGNGLVFLSIIRSSRLRTVTNTYLLNIAIADFLLLLSIPFLIITILANGWIFGNILCKMYYNFIHINQYVSSLLLAALSFDRYLAVCHPVRAIQFRTQAKCFLIIAGLLRITAEIFYS